MTTPTFDIINHLAGIERGSHVDEVRALRPEARDNAQKSYEALFTARDKHTVSAQERFALATFVAGLHGDADAIAFYGAALSEAGGGSLLPAVHSEIARGAGEGPYGHFPAGPLSVEDKPGRVYTPSEDARRLFGARLAAAFEHAHLLVFRPRDASPDALQKLLDAGWSTDGIVTVSQLISFLAFQLRVIAGLRALARDTELRAADVSSLNAALASGGGL